MISFSMETILFFDIIFGVFGGGCRRRLVPEGIEGRVPYKGSVENLISSLVGGVQAGMGYCGVRNIRELQRKASFIRITDLGLREAHVHDVVVTKEAPNYRLED